MKKTHGGVLIFVKACNFAKRNTPPWVLFKLFKLPKWYKIVQRITYVLVSFVERYT